MTLWIICIFIYFASENKLNYMRNYIVRVYIYPCIIQTYVYKVIFHIFMSYFEKNFITCIAKLLMEVNIFKKLYMLCSL